MPDNEREIVGHRVRNEKPTRWDFWIDRGGTFTDCIARSPRGELLTAKLLSSDTAPVEAIRRILTRAGELEPGAPLPACNVKLGSTVATNALLERRGAPTLLVANRGLCDVFEIGTQERPELFELDIRKPEPLHSQLAAVGGRVDAAGRLLEPFDEGAARVALASARDGGAESLAVTLIHSYAHPELERRILALALELGFSYAVASSDIARELGLLARGETATADAYLTPLLRRHAARLSEALPGSRLRFMQSSGGLTDAARFRGPTALLSGPAGGVVAAARVARRGGFERAIGFDMGGTSTDVSLIVDGEVERGFETRVGGIRVRAPMLRIHTVAAGGGSLCRFDVFRLTVGPESAGADPGPLCYGLRDEAGRPRARELALTDVNFFLGRVQPDRFPFELELEPVEAALAELEARMAQEGLDMGSEELAAGFVEIANAAMAEAIRQVSVARGVDPRDCVLVGFGGAGGQHVCAIAKLLGIETVLLHPLAGLLSAYGIGVAEVSWDGQRDAGRVRLPRGATVELDSSLIRVFEELEEQGRGALAAEGVEPAAVCTERWLDLRYAGTETALSICEGRSPGAEDRLGERDPGFSWERAFSAEHRRRFGYLREDREIEIVTLRVRARAASSEPDLDSGTSSVDGSTGRSRSLRGRGRTRPGADPIPLARRSQVIWAADAGRVEAPVFDREQLAPGTELRGPAVILEDTGTVVVDPGFHLRVDPDGVLVLCDRARSRPRGADLSGVDPVRLEVFGNRFMSVAEQMGVVLRNTSVSTNIKERLDYSCAVFDGGGGLVANAPHIPVHLGAMSETVRAVFERFPDLEPGDAVVTNDPFAGGSHLPDVTVVTPVFLSEREPREGAAGAAPESGPDFFVASRGHHADIGGVTPGSLPPDSRSLEEEGVLLKPMRLVRDGRIDDAGVRALLTGARHPARRPEDNLADLEAMVAANRGGEALLAEFASEQGLTSVRVTMAQLQRAAAAKVAREIGKLADGCTRFEDRLDDGTPICVRLEVEGERMIVDFEGTGKAVPGNLNAPRAVVQSALIYVLRSLVAERIPLNGGCLDPVELRVPRGSILDPPAGSAVVGGNVETSQRVVDALLGALGLVAASQGTMNNVTFGDESFGYYETIGGGAGAGPDFDGASGVHSHMTNTRITDPEVLEVRHPVHVIEFSLRRGSGGAGRRRGGDGLVRCYRFTAPVTVTLLTERRELRPYGLAGGEPGLAGRNWVERRQGHWERLPGKCSLQLEAGDRLRIETPGGGGYGAVRQP